MIALCQLESSLNEVFFFRAGVVFWLSTRKEEPVNYFLHKTKDDLTSDKWLCISSKDLTQWSEE